MEAITVGNLKKVLELFPDEAPLMCFDMSIAEMYAAVKFGAVTCASGKMPVIAFSQKTNIREIFGAADIRKITGEETE